MTLDEDQDKMIRREKYFDALESSVLKLTTVGLKRSYCHHYCNDCAKCPAVLETSCAFDMIIDSLEDSH